MLKQLDLLNEIYIKKQDSFIEYLKERIELLENQDIDSTKDEILKSFYGNFQPDGDYENTARESGYLSGLYDAIMIMKGLKDKDYFII